MDLNKLDSIFNDFEERKNRELNSKKEVDIKTSEMKNSTNEVFINIVWPVLEKIKLQLIEKNHLSDVSKRPDSFIYPAISLSFKPTVQNTSNVIQLEKSSILFNQTLNGDIEIETIIKGIKPSLQNPDSFTSRYSKTFKLKDITKELVEEYVFIFIKLTMDAY